MEDNARIRAMVERSPFTNSVSLREQRRLDVSTRTIRRRLHEAGVHHRVPAKKGGLLPRHVRERLEFAQNYLARDLDFWGRTIFTDEKTFSSTAHGALHCWRMNTTRYAQQHIYTEERCGRTTVNVWGWVNLNCLGELTDIEGKFNSEVYLEILEDVMLPTVRAMTLSYPEKIIFMQVI